jgi:DNA gyrase inhibitor GyrI
LTWSLPLSTQQSELRFDPLVGASRYLTRPFQPAGIPLWVIKNVTSSFGLHGHPGSVGSGMRAKDSKQIYLRRINRVIDHISNNLSEPLDLETLARLAYFSPFHFHRIFRLLVGEPLHAFVRRLRLEKAVFDLVPAAQLIGMSRDDPEITPMKKYRFDWCLVLASGAIPDEEVSAAVISANRFAMLHCRGDIHKVDRVCQYLFHSWLPRSGYQPTHDPAMEVFRAHPLENGWASFDIDCCLPVKALPRR